MVALSSAQNTRDDAPHYEKFHRRRLKGNPRRRKRKPSTREMVRRAQDRIVSATRRRGNGCIFAENEKDAVNVLHRWVHRRDGKIGKGKEVFANLMKAFKRLLHHGVFDDRTESRGAYVLAAI